MIHTEDLESVRNEALRKLGRNVVNFQKIEVALKRLLVLSKIQTTFTDLKSPPAVSIASVRKQPMGQLANSFVKSIYRQQIPPELPNDSREFRITTTFFVESDSNMIKERKKTWSSLVTERNRLIHNIVADYDPDSIDSSQHLIQLLDEQNTRLIAELEVLAGLLDFIKESIQAMKNHIESDAGIFKS